MVSPSGPLTEFQVQVARAFFELPSSAGFLLAGGAALAAQGLTSRPTQDLDLFTSPGRGVVADTLAALEADAGARGWTVRRVRVSETFARIVVSQGDESVLVDLAVDATPQRPAIMSVAGPTLDLQEPAGRKVVALFDRAEARDFADVHALAVRYGRERPMPGSTSWCSLTCSTPWRGSPTRRSLPRTLPLCERSQRPGHRNCGGSPPRRRSPPPSWHDAWHDHPRSLRSPSALGAPGGALSARQRVVGEWAAPS